MSYVKKYANIGCKYLTEADLGRNKGSQTHIGLLEGVYSETLNGTILKDVPLYLIGAVAYGTMCLDFIQSNNGQLRSPKIRTGSTDEEKYANIVRSVRSVSDLFFYRKLMMIFSENASNNPFFMFLVEGSPAWKKAFSLGMDFDELDKKVISSDMQTYSILSSYISQMFNEEVFQESSFKVEDKTVPLKITEKGFNRIVFGAPGTGKSFLLQQEMKSFNRFERVTFHPEYSYAQFVGTYKPTKSKINEDSITYEYVPGPFIRVFINALNNPQKNFLLLIEEINRANVSSVFGDVFQLLDRDSDGNSLYPIEASEDLKNYLLSVGIETTSISIPSNMYIWATMNSADQGVFPMDTAFKRRWDFEYIGINDNEDDMKDYTVVLGTGEKKHKIRWNDLRHAINDFLSDLGINEDKQIGPYFIGRDTAVPHNGTELDSSLFISTFKNKVLMYLFEDAARQKRSTLFSGVEGNRNRYSSICEAFDLKGIYIFNERIYSSVEKLS